MSKMSTIGMINTTTNAISKGAMFLGAIIMFAGAGGMIMSNKNFTEEEMKYLTEHITAK